MISLNIERCTAFVIGRDLAVTMCTIGNYEDESMHLKEGFDLENIC
jgi:hypothetical protein